MSTVLGASLDDMAIFVAVVEAGGFTRASSRLGLRKSTVSRRVADLEDRLGTRLLERTTRSLRLTEAGAEYYRRASRVVEEARDIERALADTLSAPHGVLRIATTQVLGEMFLVPVIAQYLHRHPRTEVELSFSQRRVDLMAEDFDLAVRAGALSDSSLVARKLGTARSDCVASPRYLAARGTPQAPGELQDHDCVVLHSDRGTRAEWPFSGPDGITNLPIKSRLRVSSMRACQSALCEGFGIGRLPTFLVAEDVREGRLVPVLPAWSPPGQPLHAVYPSSRHLTPKVRAFLDLLVERLGRAPWLHEPAQGPI